MTNTQPCVALYQPDIPGNTGTILRTAACLDFPVHVIEPAGFRLDDKALQRSGMDYLERSKLQLHDDWDAFVNWISQTQKRLILLTTKSDQSCMKHEFSPHDCLLFGRESAGVPEHVHQHCPMRLTIPMQDHARSLNLAVSVGMVMALAQAQMVRSM